MFINTHTCKRCLCVYGSHKLQREQDEEAWEEFKDRMGRWRVMCCL